MNFRHVKHQTECASIPVNYDASEDPSYSDPTILTIGFSTDLLLRSEHEEYAVVFEKEYISCLPVLHLYIINYYPFNVNIYGPKMGAEISSELLLSCEISRELKDEPNKLRR